ncbi:MAG: hypothetical protein Q4F67_15630 [Propionibacteriaceae bacterium]|nr:hypothetical protein [Propionibacteriaceae bacterium]
MTTVELIARHNELARAAGVPELTEWKKSKHELEARIASLPADPLDMGASVEPSAPEPKPSVAATVAELLADAAMSYAAVAEEVRRRVPGAATSARSVASIALKLRKAGHVIPARLRPEPPAARG